MMKFFNEEHNLIGEYEDRKFEKIVIGSKHKSRDPEGWAISSEVIRTLNTLGCDEIIIRDDEAKLSYSVKFAEFKKNAIPMSRGYTSQFILIMKYWETNPT